MPISKDEIKKMLTARGESKTPSTAANAKAPAKRMTVMQSIADYLSQQSVEALCTLILNEAERDTTLRKRLNILRQTAQAANDTGMLRQALLTSIGTGKSITYPKVKAWAEGINTVVDAIAELPLPQHAMQVRELTEYGIGLLRAALNHAEDFHGKTFYAYRSLQESHIAACEHYNPNPEALGEWLFLEYINNDNAFYENPLDMYAEVLGEKGATAFLRAAEAMWQKLQPQAKDPNIATKDWLVISRLREILQEIYESDPHALIKFLEHDLRSESDYATLAETYEKIGEPAKAVALAENFCRDPNKSKPYGSVQEYLVDFYHRHNQMSEAVKLLWHDYTTDPTIDNYRSVRNLALRAKEWPQWEAKMLAHAHEELAKNPNNTGKAGALLVEIHLENKDPKTAWQAALQWGCSDTLWHKLAIDHGALNPTQARNICQHAAEAKMNLVSSAAYEDAVKWMMHARALWNDADAFIDWVELMREKYKAKRNLIKLFDAHKL